MSKMYVLTFPRDRKLRTLRSLYASHTELLIRCREKTLETQKNATVLTENRSRCLSIIPHPSTICISTSHSFLIQNAVLP